MVEEEVVMAPPPLAALDEEEDPRLEEREQRLLLLRKKDTERFSAADMGLANTAHKIVKGKKGSGQQQQHGGVTAKKGDKPVVEEDAPDRVYVKVCGEN
jgi:hypothetical protein